MTLTPNPQIKTIPALRLVGMRQIMSLAENKTVELWQRFMPRRAEIKGKTSEAFYSLQCYEADYFQNFGVGRSFEKWALVPVTQDSPIPEGMEDFSLSGGLYAIFPYKGDASDAAKVFQYILGVWLPSSEYELDDRAHFELLGEKYKRNSPDSEEDIYIPIKEKNGRI